MVLNKVDWDGRVEEFTVALTRTVTVLLNEH